MKINVVLRTCTTDGAQVHKGNRVVEPKFSVTYACLNSLIHSLYTAESLAEFTLTVLDDASPEGDITALDNLIKCGGATKPSNIELMRIRNGTGNAASMQSAYNYAYDELSTDDLVLFVEDDYLFRPEAISEMIKFFHIAAKGCGAPKIAITPNDDPDRYLPPIVASHIVLGPDRRWRSVFSSTFTVLVPVTALHEHWECFWGLANYGIEPDITEENTINQVWRKPDGYKLFAPIPTLAWHLQFPHNIAPFTDFWPTFNRYKMK